MVRLIRILSLLAFGSCTAVPRAEIQRLPAQIAVRAPICQNFPMLSDDQFNWVNLKSSMRSASVDSVDKALCLVPKTSWMSVALIVNSMSLQRSSLTQPRVIFSSRSGSQVDGERLFLSFNHPGNPNDDRLELMRYRPAQSPSRLLEGIEVTLNQSLKIQEGTPDRCQKCHGIEPQFLWSQRDFWPSAADGVSVLRTREELTEVNRNIANDPRYSFLNDGGRNIIGNRSSLSTLNHDATEVNSHRLVGKIRASPNYNEYKFAVLGSLFGCYQIESFLPDALIAHHQNVSFVQEQDWRRVQEIYSAAVDELAARSNAENGPLFAAPFILLDSIIGATPVARSLYDWQRKLHLLRAPRASFHGSRSFALYTADMIRIEKNKILFGMLPSDNSGLDPVFDATSANLRFIFEGRGIGIADWSYDDIQGTYHFSIHNMSFQPTGLASVLSAADQELRTSEVEAFYRLEQEEQSSALQSLKSEKKRLLCDGLKMKSLAKLATLTHPIAFNLDDHKTRATQNWQHHFSDLGKLSDLPLNLPTNPKSNRNCTQCHFNYAANYTGPVFNRISLNPPLALMICANCHGDAVANMAPQIPFHDETALRNYVKTTPGFLFDLESRLSDQAKATLIHMPPVLLLKDAQRKQIVDYIKSLE